jgi:hypothetical protein
VAVQPTYQMQRRVIYQRPNVVTLPPVPNRYDPRQDTRYRDYMAAVQAEEAARSRMMAASSSRSRLTLPVPAEDTPLRAIPVPETDVPADQHAASEIIKKAEKPVRAEVVVAPTVYQGEPEYGTPVFGRRGFVHPPASVAGTDKDKVIIDVREYAPGEKVKDPRSGIVFLVPPTA